MIWWRVMGVVLTIAGGLADPPVSAAADRPVDLELALGIDVSGSIDHDEAVLQRQGYIDAFRHPKVAEAVQSGFLGRIAVAYYEWAGFGYAKQIVGWTEIGDAASAKAFAEKLTHEVPQTANRTGISGAIDYGAALFDDNGFAGTRRVIDLSGDGPNNVGELVTLARDRAVAKGITINGLPIVNDRPSPWGWAPLPNLDLYYRDCVIGGRGAFYEVAESFQDFARAVLRKLVLEVAERGPASRRSPSLWHPAVAGDRSAPPCDVGERNYRQRMLDYKDF